MSTKFFVNLKRMKIDDLTCDEITSEVALLGNVPPPFRSLKMGEVRWGSDPLPASPKFQTTEFRGGEFERQRWHSPAHEAVPRGAVSSGGVAGAAGYGVFV